MVSIDHMMVFCRVVETASFTLAAEELGLGKARVSQIVTRLEQQLNTRLLHRTTRSLSLTDAGAAYYQKCCRIQELAEQANSEVASLDNEPSGPIRVSTAASSEYQISLLSDFLKLYPRVELDIIESDSYSDLIESRCDVAIRASSALEDSSLYAVRIGQFVDILCASSEYIRQFGMPDSMDDLKKMSWISHEIVHGDKQLVLTSAQGEVQKLSIKPKVKVRTGYALKAFLKGHCGFGLAPDFAVNEELASGELVRLLPDIQSAPIPSYVVYQDKTYMSSATRALIDFLKQGGYAGSGKK